MKELTMDISVPILSARQSAMTSLEVDELVSVNKVHEFTETIVHTAIRNTVMSKI